MKIWKEVQVITDSGELKSAIAPLIISASRSTDIPAFHAEWFINRLKRGYACWINPFRKSDPQYISFEEARLFVFWTKNPIPLVPHLHYLDQNGLNYYFQYTLNDYEIEGFEPNLQPLANRIETFIELSNLIGKRRVIWRFDPLLLCNQLPVQELLTRISKIGTKLVNHTNKLIFSFGDILNYRNVKQNLIRETTYYSETNIHLAEFSIDQKIEIAIGIQKLCESWRKTNPDFQVATCAEDIDLSEYQISHNKCIDDELIMMLFSGDSMLMKLLSNDPESLVPEKGLPIKKLDLKDKGQRKACHCIVSKDIGSYNSCNHLCKYCYANSSVALVKKNLQHIDTDSESILL